MFLFAVLLMVSGLFLIGVNYIDNHNTLDENTKNILVFFSSFLIFLSIISALGFLIKLYKSIIGIIKKDIIHEIKSELSYYNIEDI